MPRLRWRCAHGARNPPDTAVRGTAACDCLGGDDAVRPHTPAYQVEDACNGRVVVLSGDFVITQTTRPAPDGGTYVRSRITSTNLSGVDENGLGYRGLDAELSFLHELPQQGTRSFVDAHATLLLPRAGSQKQAELEHHPAWEAFGTQAGSHPPLRGWLATPVCSDEADRQP